MPVIKTYLKEIVIPTTLIFVIIFCCVCVCVCVCVLVIQSCLTFCDPMDCSQSGFSVHGILQARIRSVFPFQSPNILLLIVKYFEC